MARRKSDPLGPHTWHLLDATEFAPGIDLHEPMTVTKAVVYVGRLYNAIKENLNEDVARKIFAPFGRPLTKDDGRIRRAADLVLKYWMMKPVPNARELARQVEDKHGGFDNALAQIKRALKDDDAFERADAEGIRDYGFSVLERALSLGDPSDEEIDQMSGAERRFWLRRIPRQTEADRRAVIRVLKRLEGGK